MVKLGDKIQILNRDGQYSKWSKKIWTVDHIARNEKEHPGYDSSMKGMALVDCSGLPVSLYEYEFKIVSPKTVGKFGDKKQVFPMKKKFEGDWYFFEEFTFTKEHAVQIANGLKKAYPTHKDRIKARVVQHGNDKLWAVYMKVER